MTFTIIYSFFQHTRPKFCKLAKSYSDIDNINLISYFYGNMCGVVRTATANHTEPPIFGILGPEWTPSRCYFQTHDDFAKASNKHFFESKNFLYLSYWEFRFVFFFFLILNHLQAIGRRRKSWQIGRNSTLQESYELFAKVHDGKWKLDGISRQGSTGRNSSSRLLSSRYSQEVQSQNTKENCN